MSNKNERLVQSMTTRKLKVVIADDEFHMRAYVAGLLAGLNVEIAGQASNGNEALALFREKKPDLLLMDINMPEKTGEDALKEIMAEFPDAHVIMLTSVTENEVVDHCIELGAANYIRKDSPAREIKTLISEALNEISP